MRMLQTVHGCRATPIIVLCVLTLIFPVTASAVDMAQTGPWLLFDFSLGKGVGTHYTDVGGVRFEISIAGEDGVFQKIWRAEYDKLDRWFPYALDLPQYAGQTVTIRLATEHIENRICCDYPFWGNPRVVVGPLNDADRQREIRNLAMNPIDAMGGLLKDGTVVPLDSKAQYFGYQGQELVTPGMCNREHSLLIYAGKNYITVAGKSVPGIYMGCDMSWDSMKYGANPDGKPYIGPTPPLLFADWKVALPAAQPLSDNTTQAVEQQSHTLLPAASDNLTVLSSVEDTYAYQDGLRAKYDPDTLTLTANMGDAEYGWAFVGIETMGLNQIPFHIKTSGNFTSRDENSFAGLVVDYHTANGYAKRVFFGLGAGSADRYDLRPGDWYLDDAAFSLSQRISFVSEFVDVLSHLDRATGELVLPISDFAPPQWDGRIWCGVGVQDIAQQAGITARFQGLTPYVPNPSVKEWTKLATMGEQFVVMEDQRYVCAVSGVNGALCGVWDKSNNEHLLAESCDTYTLEKRKSMSGALERIDQVISCRVLDDNPSTVLLLCRNAAMPGLLIRKQYVLEPGGVLSKRVEYSTTDDEGMFVTLQNDTVVAPGFMGKANRGAGFAPPPRVAQGKVVEADADAPLEQAVQANSPMVIARDYSRGISSYRFRVNDHFVMPNIAWGTRQGWRLRVFSDYLRLGQPVSAETRWVFFDGDFITFARHYQQLPEYKAVWTQYPQPAWLSDFVVDTMYLTAATYPMCQAVAPAQVTSTMWFLNGPWGNWGPDHEVPNNRHPDVYGIAPAAHKIASNLHVSIYHNFLFDTGSDLYLHDPWVGVRDREGNLIASGWSSDSTRTATFWFQMANPQVRRILVDMHCQRMKKWGLQFLYFDGPGWGEEQIDWGYLDVAQSYDWLNYFQSVYESMKEIDPDAIIFINGKVPYTDVGYQEYRLAQWKQLMGPDWRSIAFSLFQRRVNEPPGFVTVLTYGRPEADPAIAMYTIMYGWAGNLPDIGRAPWMLAALEYRGMRLIPDAVEPRWWRTGGDREVYGFIKDDTAIINLLDHAENPRTVKVEIDTAKLNLEAGRPLYATLRLFNDTASSLQEDPGNPGQQIRVWENTEAYVDSVLIEGQACPKILELELSTRPILVTSVILSHNRESTLNKSEKHIE